MNFVRYKKSHPSTCADLISGGCNCMFTNFYFAECSIYIFYQINSALGFYIWSCIVNLTPNTILDEVHLKNYIIVRVSQPSNFRVVRLLPLHIVMFQDFSRTCENASYRTVERNSEPSLVMRNSDNMQLPRQRITYVFFDAPWIIVVTVVRMNIKGFNTVQYIPRKMHTVFALLCFVVAIHWLIFPYPSGLLHWHCGNLTIAPVPAKQP